MRDLKLLNTYLSLIIPYVAFAIPMAVFILGSFFHGIPRELEESAIIDGCGVYRTYFGLLFRRFRQKSFAKPHISKLLFDFLYISETNMSINK